MEHTWLTVDELAAVLKVCPKSIRRAYRKGEIPVDRFCRFVRFDLERVKEALQAKGHRSFLLLPQNKDCLLYTSDAADERSSVDLGGRRIIKKTNQTTLSLPTDA